MRPLKILLPALAAFTAIGFMPLFRPAPRPEAPSDYDRELAKIESDLAAPPQAASEPADRALQKAGLLYRRASLTGDFEYFKAAEKAIDEAFAVVGPTEDLVVLRAQFNFKLHRLKSAEADVRALAELGTSSGLQALEADLALQEGRYQEARRGYESALRINPASWDNIARLAYLQSKTGDYAGAERSYAKAQEEISAKEMRSYAWVELQKGILDLERKRYASALAHYRRADHAYSGYWLIEEHIAEVLDLTGNTNEAIALYEKIIRTTHNPEYLNALGRIRERSDPAAAQKLYAEADQRNEQRFALYPEAAIGHLIRDALVRRTPRPDLLELAQRNCDLRPNGESKLLLARAYLKSERRAEAKRLLDEIAATPWTTPELVEVRRQVR
ncbi:MAG TPA: tetratricopeptide repeat protein [Thermoanaerobaculia bacterium]|jgi:tetratricopeptide (TPR) repeat protein|nr:tetratricopeptide repeat protein [Thermoanaerobaculia bacterium]